MSCSFDAVASSIKFPPAPESISAISSISLSRWIASFTSIVCRVTSSISTELMPIEKVSGSTLGSVESSTKNPLLQKLEE